MPAGANGAVSVFASDATDLVIGFNGYFAARAFLFNATAIPSNVLGYLTTWPQGQPQPLAATLNAFDGAITNNMTIVPTTNGSVGIFPSDPTYPVLDAFGFFAP